MLKNLKSWFVVEEAAGLSGMEEEEDVVPAAETPRLADAPVVRSSRPGKVSNQFMEVLLKAMDRENLDGFDYLEYKRSLSNLQKMDMDEATRYKSAFAMAQAMGATPAKLMETAQHYLNVLKQEHEKFGQALAGQRQKQIGDKEAQLEELAKVIGEKEQQIQKLQAEIADAQKKITNLRGDLENAQAKVANTREDFVASYDNLIGQIQSDIDKMKTYLK